MGGTYPEALSKAMVSMTRIPRWQMWCASRCSGSQSRQVAFPWGPRFSYASRAASERELPGGKEESRVPKLRVPLVTLERHLPPREYSAERLAGELPL